MIFNLYLAEVTILYCQCAGHGVGVGLSYRLDGSVFNLCRLHPSIRVKFEEVMKPQYADDCAVIAKDSESLQQSLNFLKAASHDGQKLVITTSKRPTT